MSKRGRGSQRGVSLVEALVALAVMAFGLLGVVGMQGTLRANSDIAKQRAEAVRMGQAQVEDWRAFEQLDAPPLPSPSAVANFAAITSGALPPETPPHSNASYTVGFNVAPELLEASAPRLKSVTVNVGWKDRADRDNSVRIVSTIAGIAPELAGSLGLPFDRSVGQRPRGRNLTIPAAAVDLNDGTSSFAPPGSATGTSWVFNNATGVITSICAPSSPCVASDRFLLSGFVRFAVGPPPPGRTLEQEAENPVGAALAIGVEVVLTAPTASVESCHTQAFATAVAYFCAVPTSSEPRKWSGQSRITGLAVSSTSSDATATNFKVCRYTPTASHTPAGGNASHPLVYTDVGGSLTQQNFLVISAGDGTTAYGCPGEGPSTFVNSTTFAHQPSS